MRGASGLLHNASEECGPEINSLALATATLARLRNAEASTVHYRISIVMFHGGVKHDDLTRLKHLGVCTSPDSIVNMQKKMNGQLEGKVQVWKNVIEENSSAPLLAREILQEGIASPLDVSEQRLRLCTFYSVKGYKALKGILDEEKERTGRGIITTDCLQAALRTLTSTKLPFYK